MARISIDVTPEEHARLKAMAALQGKSIKEFVLANTIGTAEADAAFAQLEALLDRRIERAKKAGTSAQRVEDVFEQVRKEDGSKPDGQ